MHNIILSITGLVINGTPRTVMPESKHPSYQRCIEMHKPIMPEKQSTINYRGIIRDPIHGFISYSDLEYTLMQHPFLRRLHNIKQLGLSNLVFPGATHTRFSHSIGVMHLAGIMAERISHIAQRNSDLCREIFARCDIGPDNFVKTARLLGLLHDIGHFPFSHQLEISLQTIIDMSMWASALDQRIPEGFRQEIKEITRRYSPLTRTKKLHEVFTLEYIDVLSDYVKQNYGGDSVELLRTVSNILRGNFFIDDASEYLGFKTSALRLLGSLISHDVFDADRLDYLERDGEMTGVVYGIIDTDRLVHGLDIIRDENGELQLSIHDKSMSSLEDIFDARYKMYKSVYYHHKSLAINIALNKIIEGLFRVWDEIVPSELRKHLDTPSLLYDPVHMANLIVQQKFLYTDSDLEYLITKMIHAKDNIASRWAKSIFSRRDLLPVSLVKRPDSLLTIIQKYSGDRDALDIVNQVFTSILASTEEIQDSIIERIRKELGNEIDQDNIIVDFDKRTIFNAESLKMHRQFNSLYLNALAKVSSVILLYVFVYSDDEKTHKAIFTIRSVLRNSLSRVLENMIKNYLRA